MVSSCKILLPVGKIGVVFKGEPPKVVSVTDFSPLIGKIKEGYVFDGLFLKDGTEFLNLSTPELILTLAEHINEEGRKIKFIMSLPDTTIVTLPSGDVGLTITGRPPLITKIADESLQSKIRVGLAVDTLTLEDGTTFTGLTCDELDEALKDDSASEGRVLTLKNIVTSKLGTKTTTLPENKEVKLPTGDLGTTFQGQTKAQIVQLTLESPMRGSFRVGLIVDSLSLPDGTVYLGPSAADLAVILSATSELEGRITRLMNPESKNIAKKSSTKVLLPKGDLGLILTGSPATISAVAEDSPLAGKVRRGLVIETICLADESEFDDLDSEDAAEILQKTSETDGRWILFSNEALPDTMTVALPAGKLGVTFKDHLKKPPSMVSKVNANSPLLNLVKVGMVVDILTLENGDKYCEMSAEELTAILSRTSDSTGRILTLKNPANTTMTLKDAMSLPDERYLTLPVGTLGMFLKKGPPVAINKVKDESPLKVEAIVGLAIDTLTLPDGQVFMEVDTNELIRIFQETTNIEGRVLLLKNPALGNFTKKPDSKEVALPAGSLDTIFKGTPPVIHKLKAGCPLKKDFTVGLFVDMLTLGDGTVMSGFTATELVAILKENMNTEGRSLLLKNPATREPSAKNLILPDEKTVILPSGILGVSFKGTPPRVSRLMDTSIVKGDFRLGMVVDTLEVPGEAESKTYAGMSSKELVKIMKATSHMNDRKIVLKNPTTATLKMRMGDFSDEPDIDLDESVRG